MRSLRLLLLSTPVGPLGSGLGGGVELTVVNLAQVLAKLGHQVAIAAPQGSVLPDAIAALNISLIQIAGNWQPTAQSQPRSAPIAVGSALANAWQYAHQTQSQYDLRVNFAYDWLPFYLTPFFKVPVAHFVSMGSLNDALDAAIAQIAVQFPGTIGAYTRSQIQTFENLDPSQWQILGSAIDISHYQYCDQPSDFLVWLGRISPEKGLEDAVAAAISANQSLQIFGKVEDPDYWRQIQAAIAQSPSHLSIDYGGFLTTKQLQKTLGQAKALLVTPHWAEAFGIVAIEALACGVPVIAYRCGGLAEIVRSGETGWLVEPGDALGLADAIAQIHQIDRRHCRQQAETTYSLAAWGDRFERWFDSILFGKITA